MNFGENMPEVAQHSDLKIEGQPLLYNFVVYHQRNDIWAERNWAKNEMGHCYDEAEAATM